MAKQLARFPLSRCPLNRQTGKQANRQTNRCLFNEAERYLAGGVNSPVRAFKRVGGEPIFMKEGKGSHIYSQDNREFIDYCMSFGALILGHSHPEVSGRLKEAIEKGTSFGTPTEAETELAKVIIQALPSIEKIRFTNSGTEAVMAAVRLARAYTRKSKVIKFSGSYHGHADYLLDCPGIPQDFIKHTLLAPYNDIEKVEKLIKQNKRDIAAIIIEPIAGNMGVVLPKDGFLPELRKLTERHKILLIFDEVITGFRLGYCGAQGLFGIKPDLTCLGKIIGGGLPVGAFGGRDEIMQLLAPEGKVYQAGTFSGNPLTVNAGLAALKILSRDNPYVNLERQTKNLCENIISLAKKRRINLRINHIASLFSLLFADTRLFKKFYHGLLKEGIYFSPSALEADFLSTAHTDKDIEKTLSAVEKTFKNMQ